MADLSEARRQMVAHQIQERGVRSDAVARAMREVPREEFMGDEMREFAYADSPLPSARARRSPSRTSSPT